MSSLFDDFPSRTSHRPQAGALERLAACIAQIVGETISLDAAQRSAAARNNTRNTYREGLSDYSTFSLAIDIRFAATKISIHARWRER